MCALQASAASASSSVVLGWLTPEKLSDAAVLLVVLVAFLALFSFAARAISAFADSRMLERLQLTLHDKLLSLSADWFDAHDTGVNVQLVERIARGVAEGPVLGQALTLAEDAWLAAGFPLDGASLAAIADQAVARANRDARP